MAAAPLGQGLPCSSGTCRAPPRAARGAAAGAALGPAPHTTGTGAWSSSTGWWGTVLPPPPSPASHRCLRCALAAGPAGAVRHLGGSPIPAGSPPAVTPSPGLRRLLGRSPPAPRPLPRGEQQQLPAAVTKGLFNLLPKQFFNDFLKGVHCTFPRARAVGAASLNRPCGDRTEPPAQLLGQL